MLSVYLDIQNVYNRANPEGVQYNFDYTRVQAAAGPADPDHPRHPGGVLSHAHATRRLHRRWPPRCCRAASAARGPRIFEPPRQRQGYYVAGGMHAALNYNRDEGEGLGPWPG